MTGDSERDALFLCHYPGSPCSRRVQITLIEKGINWRDVHIDLSRIEQRHPAYLQINPNGLVPTLVHNGQVLWESNVITRYLDDVFPQSRLYPDDVSQLQAVREWQAAEQLMARDFRPLMYQRLMGPILRLTQTLEEALDKVRLTTSDPADIEWEQKVWSLTVIDEPEELRLEKSLLAWLDRVESALARTGYLVGDQFSQADISLYPRISMYPWIGLSISAQRYPHTRDWLGRMGQRASFKQTLSDQDKALSRLSRSPLLPWLRKVLPTRGQQMLPVQWALKMVATMIKRARGRSSPAQPPLLQRLHPLERAIAAADLQSCSNPLVVKRAVPSGVIILWGNMWQPETIRLHELLDTLQLPFSFHSIDIARMEHAAAKFRDLYPGATLPLLKVGRQYLADEVQAAEALMAMAGRDVAAYWLPDDALGLARMRMWLAFDAAMHKEVQPLMWLRKVRPYLQSAGVTADNIHGWLADGVDPEARDFLASVINGSLRIDLGEQHAQKRLQKKINDVCARIASHGALVGATPCYADLALKTRLDGLAEIGVWPSSDYTEVLACWGEAIESLRVASRSSQVLEGACHE
ncbi:MAG: glutathione S-transferase N-terminal domain-containing protein [Alcanivoracaceae bacterium]|nr:glutathione S-transferase N-terminal domain-containing protein [Alcanivoracaceae bacterium]